MKVGDPAPVDASECVYVPTGTRTPRTPDCEGADGKTNAHYLLRWQNMRGQTEPWSETATATIGA